MRRFAHNNGNLRWKNLDVMPLPIAHIFSRNNEYIDSIGHVIFMIFTCHYDNAIFIVLFTIKCFMYTAIRPLNGNVYCTTSNNISIMNVTE